MAPSMEPLSAIPRSRSMHDRLLKPKLPTVTVSPRSSKNETALDDVRDGKFFHVRVTVGYLTSLRIAEAANAARGHSEELVTAYVSFGLSDKDRGEYDCATSCPIDLDEPRQNVKWPRGYDVKTSKRRLYFSMLLRSDDSVESPASALSFDDDDSNNFRAPSPYAPEFLNLYIGLKCGDESIVFAAATLVLTGEPLRNQQVDLPVRKLSISFGRNAPQKVVVKDVKLNSPRKKGIRNLFGAKRNNENAVIEKAKPKGCSFARVNKTFACEKNSVLHIKLDVKEGLYETNGPGLWGDLEDDEESFGPLPVIDIPNECTEELTQRYKHESIEVFSFKRGTTIISTPGYGEAEESKHTSVSSPSTYKQKPAKLDEFFAAAASSEPKQPFFFCGHETLVFSEQPMTPITVAVYDSLSSDTGTESSSALSSLPESISKKGVSKTGSTAPDIGTIDEEQAGIEAFSQEGTNDVADSDDDESEVEVESATEKSADESNVLLRYASRLGVTVNKMLQDAESSHGSSTYESSKGTRPFGQPGDDVYPGDRSFEDSYVTGDHSSLSDDNRTASFETDNSPTARPRGWFR